MYIVFCVFFFVKTRMPYPPLLTALVESKFAMLAASLSRAREMLTPVQTFRRREIVKFFLSNCRPFRFFETSLPTSILPATIAF